MKPSFYSTVKMKCSIQFIIREYCEYIEANIDATHFTSWSSRMYTAYTYMCVYMYMYTHLYVCV